jgi:glycerol-3-phosphate dehydrogenase
LYAPTAGIISPWEFTLALAQSAVKNGVELFLNACVTDITPKNGAFTVTAADGRQFEASYVINAAGTHCDEVAALAGDRTIRLVPTRGEYYLLDKSENGRVKHIVFQCPTKLGKGTLIAPTVHGNLIVGPNAEVVSDKDDVSTTSEGLGQVMRAARRAVPSVNFRDNIRNFSGVRANMENDAFIIGESKIVKGFSTLRV